TVPGTAVAVSDQILSVAIANGSNFYLAWNYSVTSGTTVTNAQALAIDDVSILGLGGSTNPTGVGTASPNIVQPRNSTLLSVAVTPGSKPASTGLAVAPNLSAIGGAASQPFYDDGTHGDAVASDNVFSFQATVANGTPAGTKSLPVTITDAQSRTGTAAISL